MWDLFSASRISPSYFWFQYLEPVTRISPPLQLFISLSITTVTGISPYLLILIFSSSTTSILPSFPVFNSLSAIVDNKSLEVFVAIVT